MDAYLGKTFQILSLFPSALFNGRIRMATATKRSR
ncbi:MAG: hypothetical protein ACI90V_009118 [Bacillariaceae sp.]|jgi:hypothetical protein